MAKFCSSFAEKKNPKDDSSRYLEDLSLVPALARLMRYTSNILDATFGQNAKYMNTVGKICVIVPKSY